MSYPGDSSLPADAKSRILATFEQSLGLAERGNRQEALLGCDFVLRMDPHFTPARLLQERLQGSDQPLVSDLRLGSPASGAGPASASPSAPAPADDLFDLSGLAALVEEDLPELPSERDLRAEMTPLLAARRFQEILALATANGAAVAADPALQQLVGTAQERQEAAPYVAKFLDKGRQTLAGGDRVELARILDKVRSLDPTHPGIAELEAAGRTPAPEPVTVAAPAIEPPVARELPPALRPSALPADDLAGHGTGGDSESERRIAQLLAEGQANFDAGDPQGAIDSWSRIFLIDIDHQEAARRIDQARKIKAENERQVEEIFHDGVSSLETGDLAAARRCFERVLELQPTYLTAREYLQQLDAGTVPTPRPAGTPSLAAGPASKPLSGPPTGEMAAPALADIGPAGDLKEEILVPPEPGEAPARAERREPTAAAGKVAKPGRLQNKTFLAVGGGVLALVLAAGLYFWLNWDRYFPNSHTDDLAVAAPATSPVERAVALHDAGKIPVALKLLHRVPASDPHYKEAQDLIARWETPAATEPPAPPPLPAEVATRREELLANADQAFARHDSLDALRDYEAAKQLAPLDPARDAQLGQVRRQLAPLAPQIDLFHQHEWELVLPALWRLRDSDPDNRGLITRLIVDSYYDLGVRDLQRGETDKAVEHLGEALKLAPEDEALKRHYAFAKSYVTRPQDLLYRIYVKYLPLR